MGDTQAHSSDEHGQLFDSNYAHHSCPFDVMGQCPIEFVVIQEKFTFYMVDPAPLQAVDGPKDKHGATKDDRGATLTGGGTGQNGPI